MSTNYCQHAIIGVELNELDIKVVDQEAIYENQNRYNTRTGKVEKVEKVLIQEEKYHYFFNGKKYDNIYDIENDYKGLSLEQDQYNEYYLGLKFGDREDFGRADLLSGEVSFEEIKENFKIIKEKFPNLDVKIYFIASVC